MKIYFACSITGGRELEPAYQEIVAALTEDGYEIPLSHLVESESMESERSLTPQYVYERDTKWVRECDVLIAEVSVPSHGVGYEIAYALNIGKPVLCLYQSGRKVSKMITGNSDKNQTVREWSTMEEAIHLARQFLKAHS